MMIKKSLFILPVLLFSTGQIESMQMGEEYCNNQNDNKKIQTLNKMYNKISNKLDKFKLDKTKKEDILSNITKINNEYELCWIYEVIKELPPETKKIEDMLINIIKENDISNLNNIASLFSNLTENGKPGDLFFKIKKNIDNMHEYKEKLYALSKVLDILPKSEITEPILFNLSSMYEYKLISLYVVLNKLPEEGKTKNILLNLIKMCEHPFYLERLYGVLDKLPDEGKTEKVLLNLIKMCRVPLPVLNELSYVLDKLPDEGKTEEILFNISKMNKDALLNVRNMNKDTLSNLCNVLSILPEVGQTQDILLNISKMNKYTLSNLSYILNILPEVGQTQEILLNISTMNDEYNISTMDEYKSLENLSAVLNNLPDAGKTPEILTNISKMDKYTLRRLYNVLSNLPEAGQTQEILLNLSRKSEYILSHLFIALVKDLPAELKTTEILLNISNMNKYESSWMRYIFDKLNLAEISRKTLLNIPRINNIKTLKDLNSVINNLQKYGVRKDLFLNISNNIANMDETILSNIDKMNARQLSHLYIVLDKLPSQKTTIEILSNISKMNKDDDDVLYYFHDIIDVLPKSDEIEDIIKNISEINDEDTLHNLWRRLFYKARNDKEKMEILRKFGVLKK